MELERCPDVVVRRADVLYFNGFSGFQGPPGGGKDVFVLCWPNVRWEDEAAFERDAVPRIAQESGVTTLELRDWIGRSHLTIHWSEYGKRFDVLSAMLRLGHKFQTQTRGMPAFRPAEDGTVFTQGLLERRVIEQSRELVAMGLHTVVEDQRCDPWNWTTEEGRAYATELCRVKHYEPDAQHDFYRWDLFQNYDPLTLLDAAPSAAPEQDDDACMICLERPADTMVLPCEHCVVCRQCSAQLENTPDAVICVQCRRAITHKLV